jgi:hypothetical protein
MSADTRVVYLLLVLTSGAIPILLWVALRWAFARHCEATVRMLQPFRVLRYVISLSNVGLFVWGIGAGFNSTILRFAWILLPITMGLGVPYSWLRDQAVLRKLAKSVDGN